MLGLQSQGHTKSGCSTLRASLSDRWWGRKTVVAVGTPLILNVKAFERIRHWLDVCFVLSITRSPGSHHGSFFRSRARR